MRTRLLLVLALAGCTGRPPPADKDGADSAVDTDPPDTSATDTDDTAPTHTDDTAPPDTSDTAPPLEDIDGDGFTNDVDCDDYNGAIRPDALEHCGGTDEDCDGEVDEGPPADAPAWYLDADGDGYGDEATAVLACEAPAGYGASLGECDDTDPAVNPGAPEVCANGIDDDCDGTALGCAPSGTASLSTAWAKLTGPEGGYAGHSSVASAGDPDGDGRSSVIVGAPGADGGAGAVYVLSPTAGTTALESAGTVLRGTTSLGLGAAVASGGDFDGDGVPDLLVGAPGLSWTGPEGGGAYLVSGTTTGEVSVADAAAAAFSSETRQYVGKHVSFVGDQDGDGLDDVLIAAEDADLAFLVSGARAGDVSLDADALVFSGDTDTPVVASADVNADGAADILIGAPNDSTGYPRGGSLFVFYGPVIASTAVADADAVVLGSSDDDAFAQAVADGGDLAGDGYTDIVVGRAVQGFDYGDTYIFDGAALAGTLWRTDADAELGGEGYNDLSGYSVAGVGDVDGDGGPDLLIGAPGRIDGAGYGAAYLVYGMPKGSVSLADADAVFEGEADADEAGYAVAGAGDVDGNGYDDLLVAAPWEATGGVEAGAAYVILGDGL